MRAVRLTVTAAATVAALTALSACTAKSDAKGDDAIKVTAADAKCETLRICISLCGDDDACAMKCRADHPEGTAPLDAFTACKSTACTGVCL